MKSGFAKRFEQFKTTEITLAFKVYHKKIQLRSIQSHLKLINVGLQ